MDFENIRHKYPVPLDIIQIGISCFGVKEKVRAITNRKAIADKINALRRLEDSLT